MLISNILTPRVISAAVSLFLVSPLIFAAIAAYWNIWLIMLLALPALYIWLLGVFGRMTSNGPFEQ